jgi:hypothetical protein
MQTIAITPHEMAARVARFADLVPLPSQAANDIPLAAKDIVYAPKLLSVIGPDTVAATPISAGAAQN